MANAPPYLDVGPIRLRLAHSPNGPSPDTDDPAFESLAWVLGMIGLGQREILEDIERGAHHCHSIMEIGHPLGTADLMAANEVWMRYAGVPLPDDVVGMSVGGHDTSVVPRDDLVRAAQSISRMSDEARIQPPWLFCTDPKWWAPDNSERRRLPAPDNDHTPHTAGLDSTAYALPKLRALLAWERDDLASPYADFIVREVGFPDAPWLFVTPPRFNIPHPRERAAIEAIERDAAALDQDELALSGADEPASMIQRRAQLLDRLSSLGLDTGDEPAHRALWLQRWNVPTLVELFRASRIAAVYASSDERLRYNEDWMAEHPSVCLDAFRPLRAPDGVDGFAWISLAEYLLRTYGPGTDVRADQGLFPYADGDGLIMILWRREAGHPSLLHAKLTRR